ncbi:MAG: winged helix-turn-helix transcriptional regulator [Acaryochloridaceae cyanobacterium RU_4_10]|jgi:ArsR family transcriptional regulator, arsenate/arsenite/antimonite-responsive transcriptional repressor|nr:winged helix-turn-helix transcriptional regulator [Acaryochloridaceae cyanobacterium RU_4_10]
MTTTYELPVDEIASGFHALSDPIRIKVLELLQQQELCVGGLCEALETSQSKLSFHLKVLKDAELVHSRHEGRWIYYSLNIMQFIRLERYLADYRRLSLMCPPTTLHHASAHN